MESTKSESSIGQSRSPAIIITVEGLGTNLVGCYGNALTPTPAWDRLASRAIVADQFWMDTPDVLGVMLSIFSGSHASQRVGTSSRPLSHPSGWQVPGLLVSDHAAVVAQSNLWLPGASMHVDTEGAESHFSLLLETALGRWLEAINEFPWLWIHSRGLFGPWDAPHEYRKIMCDEDDPEPPAGSAPPHFQLARNADPDIAFGCACGAGGQVVAMNETWELLESALQQISLDSDCLVILAGVLGFPLGEHGLVGWPPIEPELKPVSRLHAEHLHCPLIVRPGSMLPLGVRYAPFLQPHHLKELIQTWFEDEGTSRDMDSSLPEEKMSLDPISVEALIRLSGARRDQWQPDKRAAFARTETEEAVMLPAWSGLWTLEEDLRSNPRLYAMPDDRWQQNEVASRAPDVLERMQKLAIEWQKSMDVEANSATEPTIQPLESLEEILWRPSR